MQAHRTKAHYWYFCTISSVVSGAPSFAPTQINHTFGFAITGNAYPTGLPAFAAPYGTQTTGPPASYYNGNVMTANITSNHTGGAVVGYCDGHVAFLRDDVGLNFATGSSTVTVYQILVTPDGSKIGGEPPADENQML